MKRFAELFDSLDGTPSTNAKVTAMVEYFRHVPPADGAWAVYFLSGRRLKRLVGPSALRQWLTDATGLPAWLVEETYQHVGDLAETIALTVPAADADPSSDSEALPGLAEWVEGELLVLAELDAPRRAERVIRWWRRLPARECFLVNKLVTGSLRVGVSQTLVARALAEVTGLPRAVIAHRLMGDWRPEAAFFRGLFAPYTAREDDSRPYPFFLAHPLEAAPETLGEPAEWLAEWKWDGIRAQLLRRRNRVLLWSRGEELITQTFPEIADAAGSLPEDTVLDGEILAWGSAGVLPFAELQRRLGRQRPGRRILTAVPAAFLAYDLLEHNGRDQRERSQGQRRQALADLMARHCHPLRLSPTVTAASWQELAALRSEARERGVEGLMLKRRDAAYGTGRPRGVWWKWKVAPLTVDAVLIYAQPGHGRRANLYTDYTFAVHSAHGLVPIAKAYSGLDDAEIRRLDRWIRRHTRERFGPVRAVAPEQVFELAFEGVQPSRRHKSGVALRFPRIARWRADLGVRDADTLEAVYALLPGEHA